MSKETEVAGGKSDADFETKVKEAIRATREQIDIADDQDRKTNELKITTYWEIGERFTQLAEDLSNKERVALRDRFCAETEMTKNFYYLATSFYKYFTADQYKKAVENGMSVRVMKALVGDKKIDDKNRARLIQQAITKGLSEDEIRSIRGTKGVRSAANAGKRQVAAKKQTPRRIFTTALDRALLLEESVGFATDAVGRLASMDEKDVEEATKVLINVRDKLEELDGVVKSFLKFTNNVSKSKKGGGK